MKFIINKKGNKILVLNQNKCCGLKNSFKMIECKKKPVNIGFSSFCSIECANSIFKGYTKMVFWCMVGSYMKKPCIPIYKNNKNIWQLPGNYNNKKDSNIYISLLKGILYFTKKDFDGKKILEYLRYCSTLINYDRKTIFVTKINNLPENSTYLSLDKIKIHSKGKIDIYQFYNGNIVYLDTIDSKTWLGQFLLKHRKTIKKIYQNNTSIDEINFGKTLENNNEILNKYHQIMNIRKEYFNF